MISTYPACKTICERIDECHADKKVAVTKREYALIAGLLQASNTLKCCSLRIDYIEELLTRNDLLEVAAEEIDINFLSAGQLVSAMAIEFVKPADNTLN
ncbi:MAG: hypothetical protein DDT40_01904 [candidate division WS2 bacterium]|nr:hypothetical protein [Candidatus Psychracetigena formicireducens]